MFRLAPFGVPSGPGWRRRTIDTTVGLLENIEELAAESSEDTGEVRARLEEMYASTAAMSRRILAVAEVV
jgi:hypothetical protein